MSAVDVRTHQSLEVPPLPPLFAFCPAAAEAKLEGRLVGIVLKKDASLEQRLSLSVRSSRP